MSSNPVCTLTPALQLEMRTINKRNKAWKRQERYRRKQRQRDFGRSGNAARAPSMPELVNFTGLRERWELLFLYGMNVPHYSCLLWSSINLWVIFEELHKTSIKTLESCSALTFAQWQLCYWDCEAIVTNAPMWAHQSHYGFWQSLETRPEVVNRQNSKICYNERSSAAFRLPEISEKLLLGFMTCKFLLQIKVSAQQ